MTRHTYRPGDAIDPGATYYPMDGARQGGSLEPDDVIAALDAMAQEIENLRAELDGRAPVTNNPNDPNMKREGFTLPCGGMTVNWVGESGNIISSQEHEMQAAHSWEPNTYGHWSPWLEWRGGPCPLPGDTPVEIECHDKNYGSATDKAGTWNWSLPDDWPGVIRRFRYRVDNPAGWLPRGKFIPPAELWDEGCPVRCEWRIVGGNPRGQDWMPDVWDDVRHIRIIARESKAELPDDETTAALLRQSGKPEEIGGELQGERVDELVRWMVRFGGGHANPKWLAEHAAELAYYAYQQRRAARERARRAGS